MLDKILYLLIIVPIATCSEIPFKNETKSLKDANETFNVTFKKYLENFNPGVVWEKIDKINKIHRKNKTVADEFDVMYGGIDETDELLMLKVQNGNPKIEIRKDGRRWQPNGDWGPYWDWFSLRPRFMELIKQAIYQARYKMTIMQFLRKKYKNVSVYKMGFLMSKTDVACKTLASVVYKLHRDCSNVRQGVTRWFPMIDLLSGQERLLALWFDVDLLVDLVVKNDENCRKMLNEVMANRKHAWKFYD